MSDEWLDVGDYADAAVWIDVLPGAVEPTERPNVRWQLTASGSKWDVTFRASPRRRKARTMTPRASWTRQATTHRRLASRIRVFFGDTWHADYVRVERPHHYRAIRPASPAAVAIAPSATAARPARGKRSTCRGATASRN